MVNSVIKAITIMRTFSPEKPILSINDIAQKLDYPKSTIHSMLMTLESCGFIERTGKNLYALGKALIPMTQSVLVNVQLRDRAAPLLRELGDFCGESVYLTILDGNYCLYIYAIESSHRLLARTAVGDRIPMHCTSVGKAILAFLADAKREAILDVVGTTRFTDNTLTEREALYENLELSRKRGYALDDEEHEGNTFCIGSPIFDGNGEVFSSCSVAGNSKTIITEKLDSFTSAICYTAQEISRRMGFVPSGDKLIWKDIRNPLRAG